MRMFGLAFLILAGLVSAGETTVVVEKVTITLTNDGFWTWKLGEVTRKDGGKAKLYEDGTWTGDPIKTKLPRLPQKLDPAQTIGKWRGTDSAIVFFYHDDDKYMRWSFNDGSEMVERISTNGRGRYWYENQYGDYFERDSNGDLDVVGGKSRKVVETMKKY